jgi:hypothetical protein
VGKEWKWKAEEPKLKHFTYHGFATAAAWNSFDGITEERKSRSVCLEVQ